jgi:hypothetical protein
MPNIPRHLQVPMQPVANPAAVVSAANARFTLLTSRLIRLEYSADGRFEDRASQAFWYRDQPAPAFTVTRSGSQLILETDHLRLVYDENVAEFTSRSLYIDLKTYSTTWRYGDANPTNLKGTGRTLDQVDGSIPLEDGLISRSGWSVIDDSSTLVFNADGWLEPRQTPGTLDLYFFGYSTAYQDCLDDYIRITGRIAMLPRWALGNWWSRFWAYSQKELSDLMLEFRTHDVPLSVCIIDMDWHITRTGNASSGWTGYTWDRGLFHRRCLTSCTPTACGLHSTCTRQMASTPTRRSTRNSHSLWASTRTAMSRSSLTSPITTSCAITLRCCITRRRPWGLTSGGSTGSRGVTRKWKDSTRCGS